MGAIDGATDVLRSLDWQTSLAMFWFMVLLEVPRYSFAFLIVTGQKLAKMFRPTPARALGDELFLKSLKVSVVIAGHNEAGAMRACIRSLAEQTRKIDEIICVDDGSTDGMREVLSANARRGFD